MDRTEQTKVLDQAVQTGSKRKGDLNETVYNALKEMILSGRLGPGVRLVHQDLADQLKVSRTPVRESLERLYQEGYAGRRSRRGYFVAEVSFAEIRDLYDTREALEMHAFRTTASRRFTRAEVDELLKMNSEYASLFPDVVNPVRLRVDQTFHRTLASFSGNEYLCKTLIAIYERIALKRRLDGFGLNVDDQPLREHEAFAAAVSMNDYAAAEDILRNHIRHASERHLKHLEANYPHRVDVD